LTDTSFFFFLWWILLLASVGIIIREMTRWFRTRTVELESWTDSPRLEPPRDEIYATAEWLEALSKDKTGQLRISLEVSHAALDRVSLVLGLQKDEVKTLSFRDEFVKKTFGENAAVAKYISEETLAKSLLTESGDKATRRSRGALAYLEEIKVMMEQLSRWEKKHESSRGI
jgi:hypothetical protein